MNSTNPIDPTNATNPINQTHERNLANPIDPKNSTDSKDHEAIHEYFSLLNRFLLDAYQKGDNVALIIDEAQNLSREVFETIRLLSNIETVQDKLLQIVMIGQPELATRLDSDELRQLKQRVAVRCHLEPLSFSECTEYITKRIESAGGGASIFSPKAFESAYMYSGGIPRLINILCDNGLLSAFASGKKAVDGNMIRDAAYGLNLTAQPEVITPTTVHSPSNGNHQPKNGQRLLSEAALEEREVNFLKTSNSQSPSNTLPQTRPATRPKQDRLRDLFVGSDLQKRQISYPLVALELESPAADQYKILREHIKAIRTETGARSLLVTSAIKGEGKSMVAANLATTMALEEDAHVLLVDADLRSPQIHRYFDLEPAPGLTDYLSAGSEQDLPNFVKDTFLPNLRFIPAGKPHRLASNLLTRLKMDDLKSRFPGYQIIIDSAPVLLTSDPLVLTGHVEGIIMVVRAGKTPKKRLFEAITTLNSNKLMGIVLNGADSVIATDYYSY